MEVEKSLSINYICHMEFSSLREEISFKVRKELELLTPESGVSDDRKQEIEDFLETRFGLETEENIVEGRLNEMIERFPEMYLTLVTIDIKKYKANV